MEQEAPQESQEVNSEEELTMEDLLNQGELSLNLPKAGDVRMGMIASVNNDEILVSIGAKSEGIIPSRELSQLSDEERQALQVGEEIQVYIVSPESRQGTLILSYLRAREEDDWNQAQELLESKETYESEVDGFNKGGLIVKLGQLRGFVPGSQVSLSRRMTSDAGGTPEQKWGAMVGEPMVVRVIEVDRQRRRLILSEKAASSESRDSLKAKLLEDLKVGDIKTGRVTSLAQFGAFVNINGADGLVHLSEVTWERIKHPSEALQVGQEVKVKVISLDTDRNRIGLSMRQLMDDPWNDHVAKYRVGQLIEGTITRLTKFGAFARIDENIEGLIHISELSEDRVEHPKEVVHEGETRTLRIIKIEEDRRRVGLSIRKVDSMQYGDIDLQMALDELDEEDYIDFSEEEESTAEAEMAEEMEAAVAEVETEVAEEEAAEEAPAEEEAPVEEEPAEEKPAAEEESTPEAQVEEEEAAE
jgi:small subunit ribosomal protein S1